MLPVLLLVMLAGPSHAQDAAPETKPAAPTEPQREPDRVPEALEQRYKEMAEELKQGPPKRDFKVTTVPTQKTPLRRPDPKLLENKFVAVFTIATPDRAAARGPRSGSADEIAIRMTLQERSQEIWKGTLSAKLKLLSERSQEQFRPAQSLIDYLTSPAADRDIVFRGQSQSQGSIFLSFQVFALTAKEAEERARAIVRLYDGGYSRPLQQLVLAEGQKVMEQARAKYLELPRVAAEVAAVNARLAKPSEISPDILTQLKAQKVMTTIETAGLAARVKACDAMLADAKKLEISTLQSISDMKVKAEIERIGLKEKLDRINAFITEGDEREATRSRRDTLRDIRNRLRDEIRSSEDRATFYADLFRANAPLSLAGNQITVGPIEWTSE